MLAGADTGGLSGTTVERCGLGASGHDLVMLFIASGHRLTGCKSSLFGLVSQSLKREHNSLRSRKSNYQLLFDVMQSASEQDARDILARLRSGTDIETLVSEGTEILRDGSIADRGGAEVEMPVKMLGVVLDDHRHGAGNMRDLLSALLFGNDQLKGLICCSVCF